LGVRIQWLFGIITNALDDPQPFCPSLSEKQPIADSEVLWSLGEAECDNSAVSSADVRAIDIDYGAGLGDWTDVQHGLVFGFDSCCVGKDEYFAVLAIYI
jgi:hypothetical protein